MISKIFSLRWGVIASLLALGLLVAGCGSAQEQGSQEEGSQKEGSPPVAGSFVGKIPDLSGDTLVAVVAAEPQQGEEQREVRAYVCDGTDILEWFWGSASGNDLDLWSESETSSPGESQLEGELSSEGVTGTVRLSDGRTATFEAPLATGIAGFYNASILGNELSGTSETGARLEGRLEEPISNGELLRVPLTIASPDGETRNVEAGIFSDLDLTSVSGEQSNLRIIVDSDGEIAGADTQGGKLGATGIRGVYGAR